MSQITVCATIGAERDPEEVRRMVAAEAPGCLVVTASVAAASGLACVEMMAAQTFSARAANTLLARKPEVDLILRLAGTTQISKAVQRVGARKGTPFVVVVATESGEEPSVTWSRVGGRELERKSLTPDELGRIEKAALLDATRG